MHYKRYAESYERKYFPSNNNLKFVRADSSLKEKFKKLDRKLSQKFLFIIIIMKVFWPCYTLLQGVIQYLSGSY